MDTIHLIPGREFILRTAAGHPNIRVTYIAPHPDDGATHVVSYWDKEEDEERFLICESGMLSWPADVTPPSIDNELSWWQERADAFAGNVSRWSREERARRG